MAKHGWKDQGPFWESDEGDVLAWDGKRQAMTIECSRIETGDGVRDIPLPVLRALLAAQGLHVVRTAELKVLAAITDIAEQTLRDAIASPYTTHEITLFARVALELRGVAP